MEERLENFPTREELDGQLTLIYSCDQKKVAPEEDLESLKAKFKREAALREKAAQRERRAACRLVAKGYDAALDKARETIRRRKAEIRLQEMRAKMEALTEYGEGGFELEEELDRLKSLETSVENDYGLAVVLDDSRFGQSRRD
ncbi:Uncharacterized protein Rs2_02789 [Raphanus sativus]|nr:Uncharacterized protein Rs2_02789 [Raphanus sativus]